MVLGIRVGISFSGGREGERWVVIVDLGLRDSGMGCTYGALKGYIRVH